MDNSKAAISQAIAESVEAKQRQLQDGDLNRRATVQAMRSRMRQVTYWQRDAERMRLRADRAVTVKWYDSPVWSEFDSAALWCAERNSQATVGSPLPSNMSAECVELIHSQIDAFRRRIADFAFIISRAEVNS